MHPVGTPDCSFINVLCGGGILVEVYHLSVKDVIKVILFLIYLPETMAVENASYLTHESDTRNTFVSVVFSIRTK